MFNATTIQMKLNSGTLVPTSGSTTSEVVTVGAINAHARTAHIGKLGNGRLPPFGKRVRVISVIEEVDEDTQSFKNDSNPEIVHQP